MLKQKFRQLYHIKLRSIVDTIHLIRACCVLHNLALADEFHLQDPEEGNIEFPPQQLDDAANERADQGGRQRRDQVMQTLAH